MTTRNSIWAAQRLPIFLSVLGGFVVGAYHGWSAGLVWASILFIARQPFLIWSRYREVMGGARNGRSRRLRWLWAQESGPLEASLTFGVVFGLQIGWFKGGAFAFAFFLIMQPTILWHYFKSSQSI